MPRTLPGKTGRPTPKPKTMGKTIENGGPGSLKTRPITEGAKAENQLTIRTPIPTKKQSLSKTIEKSRYKPMPPNHPLTPGTGRRPRPGKKLSPLLNLLDTNIHLQ
jgi:hypothetical protein